MTAEKAQNLVNQVFDQMKRYLALQGGNILQRFKEYDYQQNGILSKDELKQAFFKFGFEKIEEEQIEAILFLYDPTHTGQLTYVQFCIKFYDYANQKSIRDESDWSFQIFENIRQYLKNYSVSLASQFATDLAGTLQKKEVQIESYGFFERLKFMGVKTDYKMEQRLLVKLDPGLNHKIDYILFSDLVGYEKPDNIYQEFQGQVQRPNLGQSFNQKGNKVIRDYRSYFYRTFCRHLKVRAVTLDVVERVVSMQDVQNVQNINLNTFTNQLLGLCQGSELFYRRDVIESIGKDFDTNNTNQVFYNNFLQKLKYEYDKISLLELFYSTMKDALDFKGTQNLYEILSMYDTGRNKKLNQKEIGTIFRSKNISVSEEEIDYLFDEYDPKKTGFIDYYDMEKDFQDFVEWMQVYRPHQRQQSNQNLPQILRQIKVFSDMTGKSLREIFKKTKVGDSDDIQKFDFSRIMTEISQQQIDANTIDKLTQELDLEGNNTISFTELLKRYNYEFNIKNDPFETKFNEKYIQKLYWYIAEIVVQKKDKFSLEQHFELPACKYMLFIKDLEKEPILCHTISTKEQLEQLANCHQRNGGYIDTQGFIMDIYDKVQKLKLRNQTFISLKKHLQFRGAIIEEMFKNIKGLGNYREEDLALEEFYSVLMSIEYNIQISELKMVLDTFQQNHEGKISYKDFIRKYEEVQQSNSGPQARKFFTSIQDILENIAKCIMKRSIKAFGSLLAGFDMKSTGKITRDAFYRTVDSMKFGLGEGDIQDLIKIYDPLNLDQIEISHFADDLNMYIFDPDMKVYLRSLINQTVGERIVEPSTPSPRSSYKKNIFEPQLIIKQILIDIQCGLIVRTKDCLSWFNEFSRASHGYLNLNEFTSSLEQLDVIGSSEEKNQLFNVILDLQEQQLGNKMSNVIIEFLSKLINQECNYTKETMTSQILYEIAKQLTISKVPIREKFEMFDKDQLGYVFRNEFSGNLLENYLRLQQVLTQNRINILLLKYDPQQTFRVYYQDFISDIKLLEDNNPKEIKVFLTTQEIESSERSTKEQINSEINESRISQREPEPEAKSAKNTICTEQQSIKSMKMQIPEIEFEDIMLATYRKRQAVEVYFKQFCKYLNGQYVCDKEQFYEAMVKLNLKWVDKLKISELFDAIDLVSHNQYLRQISNEDIGYAILQNASLSIQDYQAKTIEVIYKELKTQNLLSKLRDILNFFNTRRDSTCSSNDFKATLMQRLDMKRIITESDTDCLMIRYKAQQDASRLDFTKFLKDIELVNKGISPIMMWATELAEDIIKALCINDYSNQSQFFQKYSKLQGILTFDEFYRALNDLQLGIYHDEQVLKSFFNNIDMQNVKTFNASGNMGQAARVNIPQLINTIEKLCQTFSVYHIFNEYDERHTGYVNFSDFKNALENKLSLKEIKLLDFQFLAKKYKPDQGGMPNDMIQYEKFFQDYEKIEKLGLRAGQDSLKEKEQIKDEKSKTNQQLELPPDVKKLYYDMGSYVQKIGLVDSVIQSLINLDIKKTGFLTETQIQDVLKQNKMKLSTKQMKLLTLVLPFDKIEDKYNYVVMIDLAFGKQKADEVQQVYKIEGVQTQINTNIEKQPLLMRGRYKDLIEFKLQTLKNIVHQVSKASYQLRESEFYNVFKRAYIQLSSLDIELLQHSFRQLLNQKTQTIDFSQFLKYFDIKEDLSLLYSDLQKQIESKQINIEKFIKNPELTYDEFKQCLNDCKIEIKKYDQNLLQRLFMIMSEGKEVLDKLLLVREFGNLATNQEEVFPYIVNELVYYIVNNNIDLYKFVNPNTNKITRKDLDQLLNLIKFKSTSSKEIPTLYQFLAYENDALSISFVKLVDSVRRIKPEYGSVITQQQKEGSVNKQVTIKNAKAAQIKLSEFTAKVRQLLQKMNEYFKKNGINLNTLYQKIDSNKNGIVEREEFIQFFNKTMPIHGIISGEYEILFDSLDMNKDGCMSINEFCLFLEGAKLNQEQRLKAFDLDLENQMKEEIDKLFKFFDKNGDGKISVEEVQLAMRAVNQSMSIKEAQEIVNSADKNNNGFIEKNEFIQLVLPKYKEEMLLYENNLEDLRRFFKEADIDQSGYLSKEELQQSLIKLGVELSDMQLEELIKEIDLDENQMIDIDEFIAFLSIADQLKFRQPTTRSTVINIRRARKLHPIDFYNCFKNLPQFFGPSFTQKRIEQMNINTPSYFLYPQFDSKSMNYKDINKLADVQKITPKKFIELYGQGVSYEISLEEIAGVPLPRKEDFDWTKITHREVRAILFDFQTREFISNTFILQANWKSDAENKWLFNFNPNHQQARNFFLKTNLLNKIEVSQDIHLLFELVIFTNQNEIQQQMSCAWGSIAISQLDKASKQKISLSGGSPYQELQINQNEIHQQKKGFQFLKKTFSNNSSEAVMLINVKPYLKLKEPTQQCLAMLPQTCLISKNLLSFCATFRYYCYKKLIKAQQQMIAPQGNFVIAQFQKIYDNPDVNYILGECWDLEINQLQKENQINFDNLCLKLEETMNKLYAVIYTPEFKFDHVYPTRSTPLNSESFLQREILIKTSLLSNKIRIPKDTKPQNQQVSSSGYYEDYRPFNINEMDIEIKGIDMIKGKENEIIQMYQQMGLLS